MRDAVLRHQKDRLLAPVADKAFRRIHPNVISFVALGVGLLAAWAVWQEAYWLGLGLWLGNRLLDGLDGLVARQHNKQSDFGGYLDLLLDFVVYLAIPIAFVAVQPVLFNLWALIALISVYVLNTISWTVLSAILEKRRRPDVARPTTVSNASATSTSSTSSTTIEMPVGLIEGAETIIFYTLFFLIPASVGWLFLVMAGLVMFTVAQRVVWAYRHLIKENNTGSEGKSLGFKEDRRGKLGTNMR